MEVWQIIIGLISGLGIGAGLMSIIERVIKYRLEKKKVLFKEKLEAFDLLSKNIIGFSVHQRDIIKSVFENFAESARARLLIKDRTLDRRVNQFFIDLDLLDDIKKGKEEKEEWNRLQEEALEILDALNKDLEDTL